jgi:hypothetical protein
MVEAERVFEYEDGRTLHEVLGGALMADLIDVGDGPPAEVTVTAGYNLPFGYAKCSVAVKLHCNQTTKAIEQAYATGLTIAQHFARDGLQKLSKELPARVWQAQEEAR